MTVEVKRLCPPQLSLPFWLSSGGVSRLECGVGRCWWAVSVWPGLFAIRVCDAAPSSSDFPLLLFLLSSSASLLHPPPPPLPPLRLPLNSGSRDVSVAAPPPASCLPFSPASPVAFPCVGPLSFRVVSPLLDDDEDDDDDNEALCGPPPAPWTLVSSVMVLND